MNEWLIIPTNNKSNEKFFDLEVEVGNYLFLTDTKKLSFFYSKDKQEGCFIYGYVLSRLNRDADTNPGYLLEQYKLKGEKFIADYKGIFTIVIINNNEICILNDRVGASKFFYSENQNHVYATNNIFLLKNFVSTELSRVNIYIYLLFNYFVDGITVFRDINQSIGATFLKAGNQVYVGKYFDFKEFLDNRKVQLSKNETFKKAPEFWKKLIGQYLDCFSDHSITQTLTAGLDSRMILAGARSNGYLPATFTFGNSQSTDVKFAQQVAKKLDLQHHHFFPDSSFFNNYNNKSIETIELGNSLVTLFRSHRLDAYKKLKKFSDVVFFGFIGSEIIRSLYPDGLTLSRIVSNYWITGEINPEEYIKKVDFLRIDKSTLEEVKARIKKFRFLDFPDLYLFDVMIPMHFGQDIRLLEKMNIKSLAPFWDIDFLEFQRSTPFFISNSRKKDFATLGHFQRRKGPFYSSKIITSLDPKGARLPLGKGYSPKDYVTFFYLSSLKFLIYKKLNAKKLKVQNFGYFDWFKKYIKDYFCDNDLEYLGIDKDKVIESISDNGSTDEFGNMQYVKFINIDILKKLMS